MATSFTKQQTGANTGTRPRRGLRSRLSARAAWFVIALLVFGLSTFVALTQAPRPDPYRPVVPLSFDWWRYPIERNAFKRLPVITADLRDAFALPETDKVWAVGTGGMIVHSDDGGKTWAQQSIAPETTQEPPSQQQQQQSPSKRSGLFDLLSEAHAAVGKKELPVDPKAQRPTKQPDPPVQSTPPKEEVPQQRVPQPPSTYQVPVQYRDLHAVHFVDAKRGWVVGQGGTILHTADGGQQWRTQKSGSQARLNAVQLAADGQHGWVVGDEGTILYTTNGGQQWQPQLSGTQAALYAVHLTADGQRGWVVGDEGTILYTTNGGQQWQPQPSGSQAELIAVHLTADGQRGWVVGDDGMILHTTNGGQQWQPQPSGSQARLNAVQLAADGQRGWMVGADGTILHTTDGGQQWQPQPSGTRAGLTAVYLGADGQRGWVVGTGGTILHTTNGGQQWQPQTSGTQARLHAVHLAADGQRGWVVGQDGTILHTTNGGQQWQPQPSGTQVWLHAVHLAADGQRGWVVGQDGTILHTTNGGQQWQPQSSGTQAWLHAVQLAADGQRGWVVGADGTILHTTNGGQQWQPQPSGTQAWLHAVQLAADGQRGWVVGADGTILHTTNGGQQWQPQPSGTQAPLWAVHLMADGQRGWVVGADGTILHTTNGGQQWQLQTSGTQASLPAVHLMADGQRGWVVGAGGTILHTTNGGQQWQPQTSGTQARLHAVHLAADGQRGWVVGTGGTILYTTDGGATWRPISYSHDVAPWYYLSLLGVVLLLVPVLKRPRSIEAAETSVADMLISDRPLQAGEPDPLGFNAVALGLSRFLRNENTQPPLTIAITGEWGTGKSSLMNLLRADLAQYGFRPVWFNAWHHQKEEHLLASLLENMRSQAVPPWWHPVGVNFRWCLVWFRLRRYWLAWLVLLSLVALVSGYVATDYQQRINAIQQFVQTVTTSLTTGTLPVVKTGGSFLAMLLVIGGALRSLWKGVRAFGVDPASLMATMSGRVRLREFKAQAGFRHRFASEFQDVTRALHPRTMVILIDDLDRCRPENVLEVLEAVNFLVSSGDCFVIMGMALDRVERCIGLHFKDVADELLDDDEVLDGLAEDHSDDTPADEARRKRAEFARQYLEKLINIEVPVPVPTVDESRGLVVPQESRASSNGPRLVLPPFVRRLSCAGVIAAVLVFSFWSGVYLSPPTTGGNTPQRSIAPAETTPRQSVTAPTSGEQGGESGRISTDRSQPGTLIAPDLAQARPSVRPIFVGLVLLLVIGLWRLSIRPDMIVKDSPEFVAALRVWHPLVVAKRNTPRSIKRFMNRVRYYAMRQKPLEHATSVLARLGAWLGYSRVNGQPAESTSIPEDLLVALSTIQHCYPEWLEDEELFKNFVGYLRQRDDLLPAEISTYLDTFSKGSLVGNYRQAFLKLSAGIRVM